MGNGNDLDGAVAPARTESAEVIISREETGIVSRLTTVSRAPQWEYKTLSLHPREQIILEDGVPSAQIAAGVTSIVAFHTMAQDLGEQGWELVSTDGQKYWVFKRQMHSRTGSLDGSAS